MSNPANASDVVARWRSLTTAEEVIAATRLEDAWRKLKKDVPTLESRMVGNEDLTADAVRVLADAVIRLLQANERGGLRKGSVGIDDASRSWELDSSIQNSLYFTDEELADLNPTGRRRGARAYSVQPS